jgi:tetratricopeptide (TPR) repeat protein
VGKVCKFTGSKALGRELRRLRGHRSLDQISELSRSPALRDRVSPLGAPTLSQIENGVNFPSLERLYTLSVIYRTPINQLLDVVLQERMLKTARPLGSLGEAELAFGEALNAGQWLEALSVATWGEERAQTPSSATAWRANRGMALLHLGMRQHAIELLQDCANSADIAAETRYQYEAALAEALACGGYLRSALLHAEAAAELAPTELPPERRGHVLHVRAYLLLAANEQVAQPDEREVREAQRLLEQARRLVPLDDAVTAMRIDVQIAAAHGLLGNGVLAARDLKVLATRASGTKLALVRLGAWAALGTLERRRGNVASAVRALEEAGRMAVDAGDASLAFEAYFELYLAVRESDDGKAAYYLRRCDTFFPLVHARTPNVVSYERLRREA